MFFSYLWNNSSANKEPTTVVRVLFAGINRTLWCLTLAWTLFATTIFRPTNLSRFLQCKPLVTISRLSSSIYAIYSIPIMLRRFSLKYTIPWDDHIMVITTSTCNLPSNHDFIYFQLSWSVLNIVLSIASGYIIYLAFEAPSLALCKLFGRIISSRRKASLNISGKSPERGLASICRRIIGRKN